MKKINTNPTALRVFEETASGYGEKLIIHLINSHESRYAAALHLFVYLFMVYLTTLSAAWITYRRKVDY
jgi:hypothetical protein